MNQWFQEGQPSSYKVQLVYYDIPPHLVQKKYIDTPYRFATFQDANELATNLFPNVEARIVGSADQPHWNAPPVKAVPEDQIKAERWYDLYGMRPKYHDGFSVLPAPKPDKELDNTMKAIGKLRNPLKYKLMIPQQPKQPKPKPKQNKQSSK